MTRVDILYAAANLPTLVNMLENREEDVICIERDGIEIAQITLIQKPSDTSNRIGIASGKLTLPDNFDDTFDSL